MTLELFFCFSFCFVVVDCFDCCVGAVLFGLLVVFADVPLIGVVAFDVVFLVVDMLLLPDGP